MVTTEWSGESIFPGGAGLTLSPYVGKAPLVNGLIFNVAHPYLPYLALLMKPTRQRPSRSTKSSTAAPVQTIDGQPPQCPLPGKLWLPTTYLLAFPLPCCGAKNVAPETLSLMLARCSNCNQSSEDWVKPFSDKAHLDALLEKRLMAHIAPLEATLLASEIGDVLIETVANFQVLLNAGKLDVENALARPENRGAIYCRPGTATPVTEQELLGATPSREVSTPWMP